MHGYPKAAVAALTLALVPMWPGAGAAPIVEDESQSTTSVTAGSSGGGQRAPVDDQSSTETAVAAPEPAAEGRGSAETLDLERLEQRLRETDAIGFFTKLSLKSEIEDLIADFRAYHARSTDPALEPLRERYNFLLLKVQTLLQDDAPQLARDVHRSREAIWEVLVDPQRFANLQT
jgi:hypothetical protein